MLTIIPGNVTVTVVLTLSRELQQLLNTWIDQQDDRRKALKLSAEVKATTAALQAAIPPKP